MFFPLLFIFAFLPSLIWILFFLRKDAHPESNEMILKIFLLGMLIAIPAIFLEIGIFQVFWKLGEVFNWSYFLITILSVFLGGALVEEFLKYLVVQKGVLKNPEFDEPVDAMLYMIISALGFAALENILILFRLAPYFLISQVLEISIFRFLGATFLHALCSGTLGFFLALSLFETRKRLKLISLGLLISILLHGLYNFSIIKIEGSLKLLIPLAILIGLSFFVTLGFQRLRKIKSVCKIK